jgi:hypothetical protein
MTSYVQYVYGSDDRIRDIPFYLPNSTFALNFCVHKNSYIQPKKFEMIKTLNE